MSSASSSSLKKKRGFPINHFSLAHTIALKILENQTLIVFGDYQFHSGGLKLSLLASKKKSNQYDDRPI